MTHLPWAGSCLCENFASQAGWASLGSTITPGPGWALGTLTSRLMSRHISAKEAWGLAQVRPSGWRRVAERPTGTPHQARS